MARPSRQRSGSDRNLLLAVCLLVVLAGVASFVSAYTAGFVLDTLQSRDSLALIVTDGGLKSDSAAVERSLASATLALQSVRDLGLAICTGCLTVAGAVCYRFWKNRA